MAIAVPNSTAFRAAPRIRRGKDPLHQGLVAHLGENTAQAHPHKHPESRVIQIPGPRDGMQLVVIARQPQHTGEEALRYAVGDEGQDERHPSKQDENLHDIGPDHRVEPADHRIGHRDAAQEEDAGVDVQPGDRGQRQRGQEDDHADPAEHLEQQGEERAQHPHPPVEPIFEVFEDGRDVQAPQEGHEDEGDDDGGSRLAGRRAEGKPVAGVGPGRQRHHADAA